MGGECRGPSTGCPVCVCVSVLCVCVCLSPRVGGGEVEGQVWVRSELPGWVAGGWRDRMVGGADGGWQGRVHPIRTSRRHPRYLSPSA